MFIYIKALHSFSFHTGHTKKKVSQSSKCLLIINKLRVMQLDCYISKAFHSSSIWTGNFFLPIAILCIMTIGLKVDIIQILDFFLTKKGQKGSHDSLMAYGRFCLFQVVGGTAILKAAKLQEEHEAGRIWTLEFSMFIEFCIKIDFCFHFFIKFESKAWMCFVWAYWIKVWEILMQKCLERFEKYVFFLEKRGFFLKIKWNWKGCHGIWTHNHLWGWG